MKIYHHLCASCGQPMLRTRNGYYCSFCDLFEETTERRSLDE